MTKRKLNLKIFYFFIAFLLFYSCGPEEVEDNTSEKGKKEEKIGKITFYIDNSESNAGYYNGGSEFLNIVGELLQNSSHFKSDNSEIKLINDSEIIPFGKGKTGVESFLNGINRNIGKSSTIDKFFSRILNNTNPNDISILISDCILSYPDSIINGNKITGVKPQPRKNLDEAKGGLLRIKTKASIQDDFGDKAKIKPAFSVYAFTSSFKGIYWNALNNSKNRLTQTLPSRPFYIWVLSKNDKLLNKFQNEVLNKIPIFKDCKYQMHFGLTKDESQQYDVTTYLLNGVCTPDADESNGFIDIDTEDGPVVFSVCLNMPQLLNMPLSELNQQLKSYLKSSPNTTTDVFSEFIDKNKLKAEIDKLNNESDKLKVNNATHILKVKLSHFTFNKDTIVITKPFIYSDWPENIFSIDDDTKGEESLNGKTFAFDQIIKAFKETMRDDEKNIINIKIPISQ